MTGQTMIWSNKQTQINNLFSCMKHENINVDVVLAKLKTRENWNADVSG